jgi:hypothetical protein
MAAMEEPAPAEEARGEESKKDAPDEKVRSHALAPESPGLHRETAAAEGALGGPLLMPSAARMKGGEEAREETVRAIHARTGRPGALGAERG